TDLIRSNPKIGFNGGKRAETGPLLEMARDHEALGHTDESKALLTQIVEAIDADFPYGSPALSEAYPMLAKALADEPNRTSEAERLLQRCFQLRGLMYGANDE